MRAALMLHLLLCCLAFLVVAGGETSQRRVQQQAEITVKLEPFQILFITNGNDEGNSLSKMTLLQTTRDHMLATEFKNHDSFESFSLFQSIRSDDEDMYANSTHVAFGGSVTYYNDEDKEQDADTSSIFMTPEQMELFEYMCFLGKNETIYVDKLRRLGWYSLRRALLMTVSGDMVDYVDGTMKMTDMSSGDAVDASEQMDADMSKTIIFVAVFVPLAVICLVGIAYTAYLIRNNLSWKKPLADAKDPVWQRNHPQVKTLRRLSVEFRQGEDDTDDNASDLTTAMPDNDRASTKVAVAKRTSDDRGAVPRRLNIPQQQGGAVSTSRHPTVFDV